MPSAKPSGYKPGRRRRHEGVDVALLTNLLLHGEERGGRLVPLSKSEVALRLGVNPRVITYWIDKVPELNHLKAGPGRPKAAVVKDKVLPLGATLSANNRMVAAEGSDVPTAAASVKKFSKEEEELIRIKTREQLILQEVDKRVLTAETKLSFLDELFTEFVVNFRQGKIACNNMQDLDKLIRMAELLKGNADTRQSISGTITLEAIQAKFSEAKRATMTKELTGEVAPEDLGALRVASPQAALDGVVSTPTIDVEFSSDFDPEPQPVEEDHPAFDQSGNPLTGVTIPTEVILQ
jgi:hypothetical protein